MYSLIWLIYLADVITQIQYVLGITAFISAVLLLFIFIAWINYEGDARYNGNGEEIEKEKKEVFMWLRRLFATLIFSIIFFIVLPSKTVIYSLAAVKTADIAYHSNKQVPTIINNTLKLINLKIQKEIKDTLKQSGK